MRTGHAKRAVLTSFIAFVMLLLSTGAALADSQTYVVQPGDTIFKISVRFGVTMDALRAAGRTPRDAGPVPKRGRPPGGGDRK